MTVKNLIKMSLIKQIEKNVNLATLSAPLPANYCQDEIIIKTVTSAINHIKPESLRHGFW